MLALTMKHVLLNLNNVVIVQVDLTRSSREAPSTLDELWPLLFDAEKFLQSLAEQLLVTHIGIFYAS